MLAFQFQGGVGVVGVTIRDFTFIDYMRIVHGKIWNSLEIKVGRPLSKKWLIVKRLATMWSYGIIEGSTIVL